MPWKQQSTATILSPSEMTHSDVRGYASQAQTSGKVLERLERLLSGLAFVWVWIIGIQTHQFPTHFVESLPLLVLVLATRTTWVRVTAIAAGFCWLYMLIALTAEFRTAILGWRVDALTCWLAPTMVTICVIWMAANLAILRSSAAAFLGYLVVCAVLIPPLWLLNQYCMELLLFPLQQFVAGQYGWALVIVTSSLAMVACIILVTKQVTGAAICWSRRITWGNLAYWMFFVTCMILSQLPGIKQY